MAKNTGKARKKVNPFDVVVILLVICLIASFGYRVYVGIADETAKNVSEYVLEFESESCRSILAYLSSGTAVYLSSNGEIIGYFYADAEDKQGPVYQLPDQNVGDEALATGENNSFSEYANVRFGGKIRLSTNAVRVKTGDYFTVGGINLTAGSVVEVYTEKAVFTITVKNFDTVRE
jgi:hypothetical protein